MGVEVWLHTLLGGSGGGGSDGPADSLLEKEPPVTH